MKTFLLSMLLCFCLTCHPYRSQAQAAQPQSAFAETTYTFNLTPITLPRTGTTLAGAETDMLVSITTNNALGATTLISSSPFVGGRYERAIPSIANYLQNHTALTGYNFQAGLTASAGVVNSGKEFWGERAGIFLKYAPAGSTSFSVAIDAEWNNFPGIAHNIPSLAISPAWRF